MNTNKGNASQEPPSTLKADEPLAKVVTYSLEHQEILESHANSGTNAALYIGIVLLLYIFAVGLIGIRYFFTRSHRKPFLPPYYFTRSKTSSSAATTTATTSTPGSTRGACPSIAAASSTMGPPASGAFAFSDGLIETEL